MPTDEEIFRAHFFAEPLVPVGGKTTPKENADLSAALAAYAKRAGPDDFGGLTGFLDSHPQSPWNAALLTDLGLEYYHTAHYSLAMEAWARALDLSKNANDEKSAGIGSRALGELLTMNSRLGRMDELNRLLNSIGNQAISGPADERIAQARAALWSMQNRPEISFRCGPLALRSIRLALALPATNDVEIMKSASTQKGCSLPQIAALSQKTGLNYQMAFRDSGDYPAPAVVHWKVGHYAALMRQVGDLYELQDPTFGSSTWATKAALDAETSGYFLIAPGPLPAGWRAVDEAEGAAVWGKGLTGDNDPQHIAKNDLATGGSCPAPGMMVSKVHLATVNLNLTDNPLVYTPPVGPPVRFVVRYNRREVFQPANFNYGNLGPQWTSDWFSYITDDPSNPFANVNLYVAGGGQRTYTGFDPNTQSFAYQQYDHNLLTRTGPNSYQLLYGDGSKEIFSKPDGAIGTSRNVFLTQTVDPQGNALTYGYDPGLRLVTVTDAIGQVTTLTYGLYGTNVTYVNVLGQTNHAPVDADAYKLTEVTDPFGRSAVFDYQLAQVGTAYIYTNALPPATNRILVQQFNFYAWEGGSRVTDEIGITSLVDYEHSPVLASITVTNRSGVDFITVNSNWTRFVSALITPYGQTSFTNIDDGTNRILGTIFPDGSRERVEYNQRVATQPMSDPPATVPTGMATTDDNLRYRNTYYWDRKASAEAYGDYSKARIYHFLHTENGAMTAGALESFKLPLESRVWYDYAGQFSGTTIFIAPTTLPTHVGRVLDDGTTQLYTYAYNPFGHVTNSIDPVGRTISYFYDTSGIDLLEMRQTRGGKNELLAKFTYNSQHKPLTVIDAAGQKTAYSYNARGQLLTVTNANNEIVTLQYNTNGYMLSAEGPLAGIADTGTLTYDSFGRIGTVTDVRGYTLAFEYDNLNRLTRTTFPDATFSQNVYDRLDRVQFRDRAGRTTSLAYDSVRHVRKLTDPLGRTTFLDWCRCGQLSSITDPLGRMTSWITDVQGRRIAKHYGDGSQVSYLYEKNSSRLAQVTDERQQMTHFTYNADDSLAEVNYAGAGNGAITPPVSYSYDPDYPRVISTTDGIGTTIYSYLPIGLSTLGAGNLASVTGPLTNEVTTYAYDKRGRLVQVTRDGLATACTYDAAGRILAETNALGGFTYGYAGSSARVTSESLPNGINLAVSYGNVLQDFKVQQITFTQGATPVAKFIYGWDVLRQLIQTWSQQFGAQSPDVASYGYDAADQLLSAAVTNAGALVNSYAYAYDTAGNRLSEQIGGSVSSATYNPLNELTTAAAGATHTNEWDGKGHLVAVNAGNLRTEFGYDSQNRLAYLRQLQNGSELAFRRFVWAGSHISEERDKSGANILKRFFAQGVKLQSGTNAGAYYYLRDHLGSIRQLTDSGGAVRARYAYDPWGRRTKISGDLDADFGFTGMLWAPEVNLYVTHFRYYDPALGRWLSRDPLPDAEVREGPNLYAYVLNQPLTRSDPLGLGFDTLSAGCMSDPALCPALASAAAGGAGAVNALANTIDVGEAAVATTIEALPPLASCVSASAPTLVADTLPAIAAVAPEVAEIAPELADTAPAFETVLSIAPEAEEVAEDPFVTRFMEIFDEFDEILHGPNPNGITIGDVLGWVDSIAQDEFGYDVLGAVP